MKIEEGTRESREKEQTELMKEEGHTHCCCGEHHRTHGHSHFHSEHGEACSCGGHPHGHSHVEKEQEEQKESSIASHRKGRRQTYLLDHLG